PGSMVMYPQRWRPSRFVIRPFAWTVRRGTPRAGTSRMKFDHITIDVSHTPRPFLLPVWCSIRCSNSLSNSIVNAISACDSAVGSDGFRCDELAMRETLGAGRRLGELGADLPCDLLERLRRRVRVPVAVADEDDRPG